MSAPATSEADMSQAGAPVPDGARPAPDPARADTAAQGVSENRVRLRHTDRRVGLLVLLAASGFLGALMARGPLREWLTPSPELVVLLPEQGTAGLGQGADVQVLGLHAGTVRRVVMHPDRRLSAVVRVEEPMAAFIRQDSRGVIRKSFGIAGPAYLDIEHGRGEPLDWRHRPPPAIEAGSERPPTETIGAMVNEVQARLQPVLDNLDRGMHAFAVVAERLERGEGSVGRLLTDDDFARQAEAAVGRLTVLVGTLQAAAADIERLAAGVAGGDGRGGGAGGVPALLRRAEQTLAPLQQAGRDLARASASLPRTAQNVQRGTADLPALLVQTQETARELELLVNQLRGLRLLGGGQAEAVSRRQQAPPSAERIRP